MPLRASIDIRHPLPGLCGLSCRPCPRYQSRAPSRRRGCNTASRFGAACAMQTCAVKRHRIELCSYCTEAASCLKRQSHRRAGLAHTEGRTSVWRTPTNNAIAITPQRGEDRTSSLKTGSSFAYNSSLTRTSMAFARGALSYVEPLYGAGYRYGAGGAARGVVCSILRDGRGLQLCQRRSIGQAFHPECVQSLFAGVGTIQGSAYRARRICSFLQLLSPG